MAAENPVKVLLIVTGSTLRAEEVDRPLAYYLKQQIDEWSDEATAHATAPGAESELDAEADADPGSLHPTFRVRVVADFRWIHDEPLQTLPTISVGGPGVNALAHRWLEDVPVSLAVDKQYYIQMDPDLDEPRASIWGMDNATTQIAVSVFIERFLPRFLKACTLDASNPADLDDID
jgi:hypothetical protein